MRYVCMGFILSVLVCLGGCDSPVVRISEPPITVTSDTGGTGRPAKTGDIVTIDYRVSLPDGSEVLRANGFQFELGRGVVVEGIDHAVEGMKRGGRRIIQCPPHRHWGRQGYGDGAIPPNTTLTMDIRLTEIQ